MSDIPRYFTQGEIEKISKILADTYSGLRVLEIFQTLKNLII